MCPHTNCNWRSNATGDSAKKKQVGKHARQPHIDQGCDPNTCPGCVISQKSVATRLFNSILDHHNTIDSLTQLIGTMNTWTVENHGPDPPLPLPQILRTSILEHVKAFKRYQHQPQPVAPVAEPNVIDPCSEEIPDEVPDDETPQQRDPTIGAPTFVQKLNTKLNLSLSSHINIIPKELRDFLLILLYGEEDGVNRGDVTDDAFYSSKPEFIMITSIICKSINPYFISGLALKLGIKFGATHTVKDKLTILNRFGISCSYSTFSNMREDFGSHSDYWFAVGLDHMMKGLIALTHDNAQKLTSPSSVGSRYKPIMGIVTAYLAKIVSPKFEELQRYNIDLSQAFESILEICKKVPTDHIHSAVETLLYGDIHNEVGDDGNGDDDIDSEMDDVMDDSMNVSMYSPPRSPEADSFHIPTTLITDLFYLVQQIANFMEPTETDTTQFARELLSHRRDPETNLYNSIERNAKRHTYTEEERNAIQHNEQDYHLFPPIPGNPSGEKDTEEYLKLVVTLLNKTGKHWVFIGCDGAPFLNIRNLQLQIKEYQRAVEICGSLHEQMNMQESLVLLYNELGLITSIVSGGLANNVANVLSCKDTHKTRTIVFMIYISLKKAAEELGITDKADEDLTPYEIMIKDVLIVGGSFELFMASVRNKDTNGMVIARNFFYPMYFVFHHYKYARIVADDTAQINAFSKCPELLELRMNAALINTSGKAGVNVYQGMDAIHEQWNRTAMQCIGDNITVRKYYYILLVCVLMCDIPAKWNEESRSNGKCISQSN